MAFCGTWAAELENAYLPTTIAGETLAGLVWITDLL